MTVHAIHDDVHEVGLQDGCPRCEEHAESPFQSLDERMFADLLARVKTQEVPRSMAESRAMQIIAMAVRRFNV